MVLAGPETLKTLGTVARSTQVGSSLCHSIYNKWFLLLASRINPLFQGTMRANGKQLTASRVWVTSVR